MYLGELVRIILVELTKENLLFDGKGSKKLFTSYSFQTSYISSIESDTKHDYTHAYKVMKKMEIENFSDEDCENIRLICSRVSTRAAHLVAAAVATILNKMKRPRTTVGIDGSLYRFHPHFHDLLEQKIAELALPDYKVIFFKPS